MIKSGVVPDRESLPGRTLKLKNVGEKMHEKQKYAQIKISFVDNGFQIETEYKGAYGTTRGENLVTQNFGDVLSTLAQCHTYNLQVDAAVKAKKAEQEAEAANG